MTAAGPEPLVWPLGPGDMMLVMVLHGPWNDKGNAEIAGACYHAGWCDLHKRVELVFSPANFSEDSPDADF